MALHGTKTEIETKPINMKIKSKLKQSMDGWLNEKKKEAKVIMCLILISD